MSDLQQTRGGIGGLLVLFVFLLGGCSNSGTSDLRSYVDEIKARPGGRVAPLPEFKPFKTFVYRADDHNDPFKGWSTKTTSLATAGGPEVAGGTRPDPKREREQLEQFPLDALKLMGSVEFEGKRWAVVMDPDGLVYRVRVGNHMGQNHGRISMVTEERVELIEIVPDGLGGWKERPAFIALNE